MCAAPDGTEPDAQQGTLLALTEGIVEAYFADGFPVNGTVRDASRFRRALHRMFAGTMEA